MPAMSSFTKSDISTSVAIKQGEKAILSYQGTVLILFATVSYGWGLCVDPMVKLNLLNLEDYENPDLHKSINFSGSLFESNTYETNQCH